MEELRKATVPQLQSADSSKTGGNARISTSYTIWTQFDSALTRRGRLCRNCISIAGRLLLLQPIKHHHIFPENMTKMSEYDALERWETTDVLKP